MNQKCRCLDPQCSRDAFDETRIGVDATNGRFGDVALLSCRECRQCRLFYSVEYEAFPGSGRWFRGLIAAEEASRITPENAAALLERLPWHFYGGSYYDSAGQQSSGPLKMDP